VRADGATLDAMNNVPEPVTTDEPPPALAAELSHVVDAFNRAMISNDVAQIRACIVDDWVLVTPEAGIVSRSRLLHAIESGQLSHDTMTKTINRVRVFGDIAVVTGRGQNTGVFRGERIAADEWVTDVYRRVEGRWLCVLTHLTPVPGR
jgi:ketosteroid isomerase-like protein